MFIWVTLPEGLQGVEIQRAAVQKGIAVCAGDPFYEYERNVPHLRLNFSNGTDEQIDRGMRIVGEVIRPSRPLTAADLDDIFAGRPLAEQPRQQASVMCKTYLTPDMASRADMQAKKEHLSKAALLRKALAAYLNNPTQANTRIPQTA